MAPLSSRQHAPIQAACALLFVAALAKQAAANAALFTAVRSPPYAWQGTDCTLCHQDVIGSSGTATKPFSKTLQTYGIDGGSTADDLRQVLDRLSDEDSDADGRADIEELLTGTDPNRATGNAKVESVVYRYGCVNLSAAPGTMQSAAGALVLFLSVLTLRRKRNKTRWRGDFR
jgi:hypothetical protein